MVEGINTYNNMGHNHYNSPEQQVIAANGLLYRLISLADQFQEESAWPDHINQDINKAKTQMFNEANQNDKFLDNLPQIQNPTHHNAIQSEIKRIYNNIESLDRDLSQIIIKAKKAHNDRGSGNSQIQQYSQTNYKLLNGVDHIIPQHQEQTRKLIDVSEKLLCMLNAIDKFQKKNKLSDSINKAVEEVLDLIFIEIAKNDSFFETSIPEDSNAIQERLNDANNNLAYIDRCWSNIIMDATRDLNYDKKTDNNNLFAKNNNHHIDSLQQNQQYEQRINSTSNATSRKLQNVQEQLAGLIEFTNELHKSDLLSLEPKRYVQQLHNTMKNELMTIQYIIHDNPNDLSTIEQTMQYANNIINDYEMQLNDIISDAIDNPQ